MLHEKLEDELKCIMREGKLHELERLATMREHLPALRTLESWIDITRRRRSDARAPLTYEELDDIAAAHKAFSGLVPHPDVYALCREGLVMDYDEWARQYRPLGLLREVVALFEASRIYLDLPEEDDS